MQWGQYLRQLSILRFELFPKLFRKLLVYLKGEKYFNELSMLLPVLWANIEPDEDVSDGLEEEEGHHREHREEGEEVPGIRILYSSKEIDIGE